MNFGGPLEEEKYTIPQPMEGLHDHVFPPFLIKTYDMVDDPKTNRIVSWNIVNNSFVVWDRQNFARDILPKYFKHNNFSSFVRQLYTYGFKKVDRDMWEFAREGFLSGQGHTWRRKVMESQSSQRASAGASVEARQFGLEEEIHRMRRDKQILMTEVVKLNSQHQISIEYLKAMEQKLERMELNHQQMVSFIAREMPHNLIPKLIQQSGVDEEFEDAITRKRRRPFEQWSSSTAAVGGLGHAEEGVSFDKIKPCYYGDLSGIEVPELEQFGLEIPGLSENQNVPFEHDQGISEGIWRNTLF